METVQPFAAEIRRPNKNRIREWLRQRQDTHQPLPDLAEIRRELDWSLIPLNAQTGQIASC